MIVVTLIMCMRVLVDWLCLNPGNPMDYSPLGFFVHGILEARILEWVAIPFSRRSSQPKDCTRDSRIAGRFLTIWATREACINSSPRKLIWLEQVKIESEQVKIELVILKYSGEKKHMASSLIISTRYFFKRINTNSSQTCLRYKEGAFLYSVRPVLFENQNQAKTSHKKKTADQYH